MSSSTSAELAFYRTQGSISHPGKFTEQYEQLPLTVPQLCSTIQGILLHQHWAKRYGERLTEERTAEAGVRHVEFILARIQEIERGSLLEPRPLSKRFVGNCRTFSVLLASVLRSQGVPARARCGFGRYFTPGRYEDHWICEYWHAEHSRWIMVDAQLDGFQRKALAVQFDPLDVPRDQFIIAGKAWLSCRNGEADPNIFGIFDMHGLWFIRGNLIRDIASLNKVELLPWDGWGLIDREDDSLSKEELALLDRLALITADLVDFLAVREAYESQLDLKVPPVIKSYSQSGTLDIELATENVVA